MYRRLVLIILTIVISTALAQDTSAPGNPPLEDKRAFGVIPNNRTTEGSLPFAPISSRHKMAIAAKDSFAVPLGLTSGFFAAWYQLEDQNPSYGQGMAGYSRRLAAAFGDQAVGNMMTEGVMPTLLHEDPRYFRVGVGTTRKRLLSALEQIMVTRTDSGGRTFNFSEWGGNAVAATISNAWYPDTRSASENLEKVLLQCAADSISNVLKEFWPDVKHHFQRKREAALQAAGN
jgi:hypothetical protein